MKQPAPKLAYPGRRYIGSHSTSSELLILSLALILSHALRLLSVPHCMCRRLQARRSEPQSWSTHALLYDDTIAQQSLYSVYVHTAPGFSYAPGNLFAGYEVGDRVQVVWGQHSVVRPLLPSVCTGLVLLSL